MNKRQQELIIKYEGAIEVLRFLLSDSETKLESTQKSINLKKNETIKEWLEGKAREIELCIEEYERQIEMYGRWIQELKNEVE